jgi:hypothetical protein
MRISRQPSSFIKGRFFAARMIDREVNSGCLAGPLPGRFVAHKYLTASFIRLRLRFALGRFVPVSAGEFSPDARDVKVA